MNTYAREYAEYSEWLSCEKASPWCDNCGGWGDHGFEEDSGLPYICYSCGGTGKLVDAG